MGRLALIICAVWLAALSGGVGLAQIYNPTGRPLDLQAPLYDQGRLVGQVTLHMTPDDILSVHGPGVRKLLDGALSAEALATIAAQEQPDGELLLADFGAAGITASYDPSRLAVNLEVPPEARPTYELGLGKETVRAEDVVAPEMVSGYLTIRAAPVSTMMRMTIRGMIYRWSISTALSA